MSDDSISRQTAIDEINEIYEWHDNVTKERIIEHFKRLPSAQKKGHWIDEGTNYCCSECYRGCWVNSNYCPWCGADMRGETDG